MEKNKAVRKGWNDICNEILLIIFTFLNVGDLAVASLVCKSWNQVARDPSLWKELDLSRLNSYYFNIPNKLRVFKHSSTKMTQFLKYVLGLSNGNTTCLIFNYYVYLTDEQFITAAQRTPNLKRLVLPKTSGLTRVGVRTAMKFWRFLESITITSAVPIDYIILSNRRHCKNITELKFTCGCIFAERDADAMIKFTPNLKVLSIRSIAVTMEALNRVLTFLKHLEVVNICHTVIIGESNPESIVVVDHTIFYLQKYLPLSSLEKLIFCIEGRCLKCKNGEDTTPSRQPYGPWEDTWRADEITSLSF